MYHFFDIIEKTLLLDHFTYENIQHNLGCIKEMP